MAAHGYHSRAACFNVDECMSVLTEARGGLPVHLTVNACGHDCDADVACCLQHEVGVRNLEILKNTTDARGRKLEVVKVHCPPPLFRTYKEAEGVSVSRPLNSSRNSSFCL